MRIDVEPVTERADYVVELGFKSIERDGLTSDDVLILPTEQRAARARLGLEAGAKVAAN